MLWYFYYTYLHEHVNLGMYKYVHFLHSMQKLSKNIISTVVTHQLFYSELQICFGCPFLNVSESLSLNIVMFSVSLLTAVVISCGLVRIVCVRNQHCIQRFILLNDVANKNLNSFIDLVFWIVLKSLLHLKHEWLCYEL